MVLFMLDIYSAITSLGDFQEYLPPFGEIPPTPLCKRGAGGIENPNCNGGEGKANLP